MAIPDLAVVRRAGKQATNQVTTHPDFARPSETSPDTKTALICGSRTQRDAVGRNRHAWHACGHVKDEERVKALKRQMFGRANLDLLRKRILLSK
jgi:hypothetical protein